MKNPRAQNLSPALILIALQIAATGMATPNLITGNIGGNATLPCVFPELKGFPLDNIRVNWQTKKYSQVLLFMNSGKVEDNHTADRFKGRTGFFQEDLLSGNFSLLLAGLVARDEDNFCCYIQMKGNTGYSIWNSSEVRLEVSGSLSQPLLEGPGKHSFTCKDSINFTCTSMGEYPQPQIEWTVNQKKYHAHPNVTLDHHLDSKLFNVSSILTITASEVQSIQCLVINTRNQKVKYSVSLSFPNCAYGSPTAENPAIWKIALGVIFMVVVLIVISILFRKYRWPSSRDPINVSTVLPIAPANGSTSCIDTEFSLLSGNHTETFNNTD